MVEQKFSMPLKYDHHPKNDICLSSDKKNDASSDTEKATEQIIMSCGMARTLVVGSGSEALVASLLRRGVDAYGLEVSQELVSFCNQRFPDRFTQGSVFALPFENTSFHSLVLTNCTEYLTPDDVPKALQEIHRVTDRYVFLKLSARETQSYNEHWHLATNRRMWWESKCFEAGFRKHPAYYKINPYESLNEEAWEIIIPLEKIPTDTFSKYPLASLKEERDLHMDMLREHGSRSDAHVSRYHFACTYIRPGDSVIDAACGLGYGSHIIRTLTKCSTVMGIDGSADGISYANSNFVYNDTTLFVKGFLPECLYDISDNSVDCVISFETLEHVENPKALLAEFYRILTPGGRFISSVPNDWSDESGQDPNPFHIHVYTHSKFISELTQFFDIEHLLAQTADRVKKPGNQCEWALKPRSFRELDLNDDLVNLEAEWLIAVTCKSPLSGTSIPYIEKVFTQQEQIAGGNALAFARDYQNPWLIRSLISIGLRTENRNLRERWALKILDIAPTSSPDYGAALCILAYSRLENPEFTGQAELRILINQFLILENITNPNVLRWKVSLSYVQGLTSLAQGSRDNAKQWFKQVTDYPAALYSPTLLTKTAEAAYLLGLLHAADGEFDNAVSVWSASLSSILRDIGQHLNSQPLHIGPEFELREITTVFSVLGKLVVAINHVKKINHQPTVFFDQVNSDFVAKLRWLASQRDAWEKVSTEREQSLVAVQSQIQDLLTGNAWLASQCGAWEKASTEHEQSVVALQSQIQDLLTGNAWLASQRDAWEKASTEREQSVVALQSQIQDLLTGNAWLASQRDAWEKVSTEREQSVIALQSQIQDLLTGNAWLASQRDAWEKVATEREQSIMELASDLHLSNKRLSEIDAILTKIRNHWVMRFVNRLFNPRFF